MKIRSLILIGVLFVFASSVHGQDRTILPPPEPEFKGSIGETYKDSTPDFSPALPLTAPQGAPNILIVLLDDVGFGQIGC